MNYVSFKIRIYAFLLDYLLILIYGIFVVGSMSIIFRPYFTPLFSRSPIIAELTGFFMITLPVGLYFVFCESSKWQGTWGKRKLGVCVVDNNGQRINLLRSTTRTIIKFLPWEIAHFGIWHLMLPNDLSEITVMVLLSTSNLLLLLYLLVPLFNKRVKNVYDWPAGTVVIREL
jgi:uncharacterized RDD family membrane protein YckC